MGKSEYFSVRLVPGENEQPQILLDAMKILGLMRRAEEMMTKVDRIRYATPCILVIQDVIRDFYLSYKFEDDREIHLKRMFGNIGVLLIEMRIIAECNAICIPVRFDSMTPDRVKLELMNSLASLDEGANKWINSFLKKNRVKGKSGING